MNTPHPPTELLYITAGLIIFAVIGLVVTAIYIVRGAVRAVKWMNRDE